MRFEKGKSGNPSGKPKGAKDKRTELRALLQPHAKELVENLVKLAKGGDTTALRICMDRLIPPLRAADCPINIGELSGSLADQGAKIIAELSIGNITPDEALGMLQAITLQARIVEVDELERRIAALERKANGEH